MTEMMSLGWIWQKELQGKIFANFNMIFKKANKNNNNKRLEENIQGDLLHRQKGMPACVPNLNWVQGKENLKSQKEEIFPN